jgi:hypothetical protein
VLRFLDNATKGGAMKDILESSHTLIGNIVMPIPLPTWQQTITTEDICAMWKSIAEFSSTTAPSETTKFGVAHYKIRAHSEPFAGITSDDKQQISLEFFQISQLYSNQDFALAWSESAAYTTTEALRTKFPASQKIRYLYVTRCDVGRDRWPHGEGMTYFPVAINRAKILAKRTFDAIIEKFPAPQAPPSPTVM